MLRCFILKDNIYLVDSHSLIWQKALKAIHQTDPKLEYFRKKMLEALEAQEKGERLQKAGFPIGTIREWRGKKFIKIAPNKWRPKYDAHTRGAKLAIRAIKRKVDLATSSEELLQITLGNSSRFRDSDGHLLPFVKELRDYISTRNLEIENGKGGGNGGEPPIGRVAKLRQELKEKLKSQFGLHINKKTGIKANLSGHSVSKISSDKAIEKSKANGFTVDEHFEVAEHIVNLYENAELVETSPDKRGSPDIISIKRFDVPYTFNGGKKSIVHITVKENAQSGHKIYSSEVMKFIVGKKNALIK